MTKRYSNDRAATRRDLMTLAAAALAAGVTLSQEALAQSAQGTAAPPGAKPGTVKVEQHGPILLIGIDRADAGNRLDPPILIGLGRAFQQLEHDEALRVAVLHGIGPNFCLGLDVPAFVAAQAAGQLLPRDPDFINPFGLRPPLRSKPLISAAAGGAKFGGHELFLSADIRVAAADAVFGQAEVTRGVFPAGGATVRFVRDAGWGNAMRYMLTGEEWGAEEARRLGLVQDIAPPGQQLDRAIELAQRIADAAPLGVRQTLASARQALPGEAPALEALQADFTRILASQDAKEARDALSEGRKPAFRGL
jgi:enoyl-CoA hydratase/carnithine racemase